ncbi:MarR family transcriptional regulator [Neptunomonas antarctica]|uniref:Transcriptional regulator, MarR family n=1 Tax=Neptunomonas antarctica TaxID=619304 RepID=A0A1N7IY98_9GAMM|nr:MarR family transcriptional regulator [Neptunomonas antarctica]SIS42039.1 transcriptional regulator, MarR family [Neptunomonas antarctica]
MSGALGKYRKLKSPALGWLLGRVFRLWRSAISQSVKPMGMTEARWSVMMNLKILGEGTSQHRLAGELGIEMPSLTRTVNQLVELNLVERRAHPSDGRCQCLWFTETGHECLQTLTGCVDEVRSTLTQGISDEELDIVFAVLKKLEHNAANLLNKHSEGDK